MTTYRRRRLAAKGKKLGRKLFDKIASIVTRDTILLWYQLIRGDAKAELGSIDVCERLGGLLKYYHRSAA